MHISLRIDFFKCFSASGCSIKKCLFVQTQPFWIYTHSSENSKWKVSQFKHKFLVKIRGKQHLSLKLSPLKYYFEYCARFPWKIFIRNAILPNLTSIQTWRETGIHEIPQTSLFRSFRKDLGPSSFKGQKLPYALWKVCLRKFKATLVLLGTSITSNTRKVTSLKIFNGFQIKTKSNV